MQEDGESGEGGGWLKWALIVPLSAAAGALMVRTALHRAPATPAAAAPRAVERAAVPAAVPEAMPAPAAASAAPAEKVAAGNGELQSDDYTTGEAGVVWGGAKPAAAPAKPAATAAAPEAPADPAQAKKDTGTGFMYGALTKLSGKLLDNPKALTALFNNEYVVKGFMSRDTVKQATASKASLAAYLSNPANVSKFMSKAPVQEGLKRPELLKMMAGTKMVSQMMDTPGGKALSQDPMALAQVVGSNPALVSLMTDPAVLSALMSNPKTAVLASSGAGVPRR